MKRDRRREPSIAARLQYLDQAIDLARGRTDDAVIDGVDAFIERAGHRLSIAGDHTVVALAGATGSGKSSTLNALTGTQLAVAGVTRPTTSEALAVAWGSEQPTELLDWLGVTRRHLIASGDTPLRDVVLLDLPDHDSTEVAHRLTVDRLVELVDTFVWVVDPQKYADSALHDGYLKPLAAHAAGMVVVLNQVDRLNADQRDAALADLRRLLDAEGLAATRVLAVSAVTGEGMDALRDMLVSTAQAKAAATRRFTADAQAQAALLAHELGTGDVPRLGGASVASLNASMADAAAVGVVVDGVRDAWRHRGAVATGWPLVSWVKRLRPDPLRRLRVGLSSAELGPTDVSRTSLPRANAVQSARVDAALRGVLDAATEGVPRGWAEHMRGLVRSHGRTIADRLDAAVAGTDLRMDSGHGWWAVVQVAQWLLVSALVVGGVWLALPLVLALLQVPWEVPFPSLQGWPWPTLLVVGAVVGGVILAVLSRVFVEAGARVKARQARARLMEAVSAITASDIVDPLTAELERLSAAREAVSRAL